MNNAARVGRLEPFGDLDGPIEQQFERHRLVAHALAQRRPLQEFHHQEGMAYMLAHFVEGTDVGMIDRGGGAGFPFEALQRRGHRQRCAATS